MTPCAGQRAKWLSISRLSGKQLATFYILKVGIWPSSSRSYIATASRCCQIRAFFLIPLCGIFRHFVIALHGGPSAGRRREVGHRAVPFTRAPCAGKCRYVVTVLHGAGSTCQRRGLRRRPMPFARTTCAGNDVTLLRGYRGAGPQHYAAFGGPDSIGSHEVCRLSWHQ